VINQALELPPGVVERHGQGNEDGDQTYAPEQTHVSAGGRAVHQSACRGCHIRAIERFHFSLKVATRVRIPLGLLLLDGSLTSWLDRLKAAAESKA
jgi:hypothetical protein